MYKNNDPINQIALTLAKHFDSLYYVDIETGQFSEHIRPHLFSGLDIPGPDDDFFSESAKNAPKYVHPDDIEILKPLFDKDTLLKILAENGSYSAVFRLVQNGKIIHMQHHEILCEDQKHIICCLENVDKAFREKQEKERDLRSAERMARLDALTGIKNKNAFSEYVSSIDSRINSGDSDIRFGIVVCDMNDLKLMNDTRGHSFGDEAIRRASCMICDAFGHSPVFRIGGDEFVVIIDGRDYDCREELFGKLREESVANKRARSGPVVACGMTVYEHGSDKCFDEVFERADREMYEDKNELKSMNLKDYFMGMEKIDTPIPAERKRLLDGLFEALCTIAGEGYVYLNDMRYDFSRWSLTLVNDFGLSSEYMYHADLVWQDHIHPDDMKVYREAVDAVLSGTAELRALHYRARMADGTYAVCFTRGFVLSDSNGDPEYFGGIIITE